ncbi:hypothetical protein EKH55_1569 [Sinorhizobium alkalisoli]|nr:hypothetical protein EKH55_1569 [Sinorhizobium alkalisoli]
MSAAGRFHPRSDFEFRKRGRSSGVADAFPHSSVDDLISLELECCKEHRRLLSVRGRHGVHGRCISSLCRTREGRHEQAPGHRWSGRRDRRHDPGWHRNLVDRRLHGGLQTITRAPLVPLKDMRKRRLHPPR